MIEVLFVLIIASLATSVLGVFLILKKQAMTTDAISHTILLGIVLAFFITQDIRSPWLIIGAALIGVLTVYLIQLINQTNLIKNDASIGIVFTALFAIAIILISRYADNVHLDIDVVIAGEVLFAPLNRIEIFGFSIPRALWQLGLLLIINTGFVALFYKELKVSTFDPKFAYVIGFSTTLIYYMLMTLVSVTAVVAFDAVGAILVINFFVAPALTAYLLVKRLSHMISLTALFAVLNSTFGYLIGYNLDLSMSGATATVAFLIFTMVFLFKPDGYIILKIKKRRQKKEFMHAMILMLMSEDEHETISMNGISKHFNLTQSETKHQLETLEVEGYIVKTDGRYMLTLRGEEFTHYSRIKYELRPY